MPAGSIALVDRAADLGGTPNPPAVCNYYQQAMNAQNAGAVALVVIQTGTGNPEIMTGDELDADTRRRSRRS